MRFLVHIPVPLRFPRRLLLVGIASVLALVAGCSKKENANVLAKVGPSEIQVDDFKREWALRAESSRTILSSEDLLEELISRELLLLKAKQSGLEQDPEVRRAIRGLLVNKLKERELKPRAESVEVTADEVRARYEQNRALYRTPAKARLAILYLQTDAKASEARLAEARARMAEARAAAGGELPDPGRGFGGVALTYSEDQASRYKGGDIGWLDVGREGYRWPKEVVAAGFALKNKGDVSDVIQTAKGLYLVAKLDTRAAVTTPLEQVEVTLRRQLAAEKRQQVEQAFMKSIREGVAVKINATALASLKSLPVNMAKAAEPPAPGIPGTP